MNKMKYYLGCGEDDATNRATAVAILFFIFFCFVVMALLSRAVHDGEIKPIWIILAILSFVGIVWQIRQNRKDVKIEEIELLKEIKLLGKYKK